MFWAKKIDTTVKWYCDSLGYTVDYHASGEFAMLSHPGMGRLALHAAAADSKDVGHGPLPYWLVPRIDEAMTWLRARGVKVEDPQVVAESPKHTWFYDCEGNQLGIAEG
jgi:hypothetical protein